MFLAGYRITDSRVTERVTKWACKDTTKSSLVFKNKKRLGRVNNAPVSRSLGCHVVGAVPPIPGRDDLSMVSGVQTRVGFKPGSMSRQTRRALVRYTRKWCAKHLVPLRPEDVSFEGWVSYLRENHTYPASRITELEKLYHDRADWFHNNVPRPDIKRRLYKNKCFRKEEFYEQYKQFRGIMSRSDMFKCYAGPVFHQISQEVFHCTPDGRPCPFIKHTPVHLRPKVMKDYLYTGSGDYYYETDFSSFESHFTKDNMEAVEFVLYDYMTQRLDPSIMATIREALQGENFLEYRNFVATIGATRMSGEMNTSLGNGFFNFIMTSFIVHQKDPKAIVKGFFEGDDGLYQIVGSDIKITSDDYTRYGLNIKINTYTNLADTSFCGNRFDPEDENLTVVTDPLRVLAKTGWCASKHIRSKSRVRNSVLRNKGFSLIYQYKGCPILEEFGKYILRNTYEDEVMEERLIDQAGWWERFKNREMNRKYVPIEISQSARLLVEKRFGISVEMQLQTERYFQGLDKIQPLRLDWLSFPDDWKFHYQHYTMKIHDSDHCVGEGNVPEVTARLKNQMSEITPSIEDLKCF